MEFQVFAAKLETTFRLSEEQKTRELAQILSELELGERAPAVYLLQGRLGLPTERRSPSQHLDDLGAIQTRLHDSRARGGGTSRAQPSVTEVYLALHDLILSTDARIIPADYAVQLRDLLVPLDDTALEWLARILWDRPIKSADNLYEVLVSEAFPPQAGPSVEPTEKPARAKLKRLCQTTLNDLGHIAELLARKSFSDVLSMGPQHGFLIPREEIQIWPSVDVAWKRLGGSSMFVQGKLDGEHIQIHIQDEEVIILASSGENITAKLPDVIQMVQATLPSESAILDAEIVGFSPADKAVLPLSYALRPVPHQVVVFDLLLWCGEDWRDRGYWERRQKIEALIPYRLSGQPGLFHAEEIEARSLAEAAAAYESFLEKDYYEGVIVKLPVGKCRSGQRSHHRGKVKPYTSLDSVLLGYNARPESFLVGLWQDERQEILIPYRVVETVKGPESLRKQLRAFCQTNRLSHAPPVVRPGPKPQYWVVPRLVVDVDCDGYKVPSRTYVHSHYTLRRHAAIRGLYRGKGIYQANDLRRLLALRDPPGRRPLPGDELPVVQIYTDGSCIGNPGPGGWAAILKHDPKQGERLVSEVVGSCSSPTTNSRMELAAVLAGLGELKRPCRVTIHTDSQYVHHGGSYWMSNWKRRGWRKASGEPLEHSDLWEELDTELQRHQVSWRWIKAHNMHPENERADRLARAEAEKAVKRAEMLAANGPCQA